MVLRWSRWKSLVTAVMVGFAEASGIDVGRPELHTPYSIVQLDDSRTARVANLFWQLRKLLRALGKGVNSSPWARFAEYPYLAERAERASAT